ncbi:hypothetical protein PIB30_086999, partial [Stylosanthes scabra]|nr:hypothetical protein [Stylosanthes scabra]
MRKRHCWFAGVWNCWRLEHDVTETEVVEHGAAGTALAWRHGAAMGGGGQGWCVCFVLAKG